MNKQEAFNKVYELRDEAYAYIDKTMHVVCTEISEQVAREKVGKLAPGRFIRAEIDYKGKERWFFLVAPIHCKKVEKIFNVSISKILPLPDRANIKDIYWENFDKIVIEFNNKEQMNVHIK